MATLSGALVPVWQRNPQGAVDPRVGQALLQTGVEMLPGAGDAAALRDALRFGQQMSQSFRQGDIGGGVSRLAEALAAGAGALPLMPYFGGTVKAFRAAPQSVALQPALGASIPNKSGYHDYEILVDGAPKGAVSFRIKGDTLWIDDIYALDGRIGKDAAGSFGPARVREILKQIRGMHPEVTKISGERVSGARAASGLVEGADSALNIGRKGQEVEMKLR